MGRPLLHLPVAGAATGVLYAGSLALVSLFQAHQDAALARERAPLVEGVAAAVAQRSTTLHAIEVANRVLGDASASYESALARSRALDDMLALLARHVGDATGAAAQLPTSDQLPAAPAAATVVPPAAPATNATTGASGR